MSYTKIQDKQQLIQERTKEHYQLRQTRRLEILQKKRIEIEEKEREEKEKERIPIIMKEETITELIQQVLESTSNEILEEKLRFIKPKIHLLYDVEKELLQQFIKYLLQLINKKEILIASLSLLLLNEMILLSTQFSIYIEEFNGIEIMNQNCVEKELLIPIVKVIGNLLLDKRDKCYPFLMNFVPFALSLNDIELMKNVSWMIDCAASRNYDVTNCIEMCLSLQDIEIQTNILDACLHLSKNNKSIPIQQLLFFLNDSRSRWFVIEILANEAYHGNYLDDIFKLLPQLLQLQLLPKEIMNIIWIIEILSISLTHLIQINSIGCIEYVIKQSYSMDISIKRQCCYTLSTFISLCSNDIQSIQYLIDSKIIQVLFELVDQYQSLEIKEIEILLDTFMKLLEMEQFDSRIIEQIEENTFIFENILFDSSTSTKISKKVHYILTTYFEM